MFNLIKSFGSNAIIFRDTFRNNILPATQKTTSPLLFKFWVATQKIPHNLLGGNGRYLVNSRRFMNYNNQTFRSKCAIHPRYFQ